MNINFKHKKKENVDIELSFLLYKQTFTVLKDECMRTKFIFTFTSS